MKDINEIEDFLEELAEEIEPHLQLIPKFLSGVKKTNKPLSVYSMTSFFPKIESIRVGIFEVAKAGEYYSLNILFRSLIEHFIKAQFLWMKTVENEDDEIGIDYWVFGQDQEKWDYAKALRQSYSMVGIEPVKDPIDILKDMGIFSAERSANQIRKKSEQFKYKSMTHYIAEQMKAKEIGAAPILDSIFPRYSKLSSCVHGGPDSVRTYQKGPEAIEEMLEMATFASIYTRWSAFILLYQYDESVEPLCQVTQKYLHKFTGITSSSTGLRNVL